jgi:hypothetical protein
MHPTPTVLPVDQTTVGGAMSIAEFCRWACIGRTKAYSLFKAGHIRPRKLGAKTIVLRADAEKWLSGLPIAAAS